MGWRLGSVELVARGEPPLSRFSSTVMPDDAADLAEELASDPKNAPALSDALGTDPSDATLKRRLEAALRDGELVMVRVIRLSAFPDAIGEPMALRDLAEQVLPPSEELHSIEFNVLDANDEPVEGVRCTVELPDGRVRTVVSDQHGNIYIDGITSRGDCKISIPGYDDSLWEME